MGDPESDILVRSSLGRLLDIIQRVMMGGNGNGVWANHGVSIIFVSGILMFHLLDYLLPHTYNFFCWSLMVADGRCNLPQSTEATNLEFRLTAIW